MTTETDVLIAGAGPTGLMTALCLAERGVRCRIIDKAPVPSDKSRALVVQARTLELFQRLGFADELIKRGRTMMKVHAYVDGRKAFDIDLSDIGADDTPFPYVLFVSQAETEAVLDERLRKHGVAVERPVEALSFTQDATGVEARLRHGDGREETVRTRYLVGADGAHSVVRKGAGLQFEGAPYQQNFMLADVEVDWAEHDGGLCFFLSSHGLMVAFPMRGESRFRLIVSEAGGPSQSGDPTLDEMQATTSRLAKIPVRLHDPHWLARFHLHHRGVDRYRAGRVFVAGDAAHIHSPAGGQGMNTGLQDSANLAWKLGLVVHGFASESLLDSYDAERRPVGQNLLRFTDRMFSFGATQNPFLIGLRNFLAPHLVPFVISKKERRARAFRFVSQLGIRYRRSPIVASSEEGFEGGPRAGERFPDGVIRLASGESSTLFKQLSAAKHDLLVFGQPEPGVLQALETLHPSWMRVLTLEASEELRKRLGVTRPSLYLVRPDGYLAFRTASVAREPIEQFVKKSYGAGQPAGEARPVVQAG